MARQPNQFKPVTKAEREAIIAELHKGRSRYAVAKEFRRARETVAKIAREAGMTADTTSTEAATRARSRYAAAQRVELINKFFERIEERIDNLPDDAVQAARAIRDLSTSLGIAIDKRRLEDGDTTGRVDVSPYLDALKESAEDVWSDDT